MSDAKPAGDDGSTGSRTRDGASAVPELSRRHGIREVKRFPGGSQRNLGWSARVILAVNCGSSSLRFQVFTADDGASHSLTARGAGYIERFGPEATVTLTTENEAPTHERVEVASHEAAVEYMLGWVAGAGLGAAPDAVGHRIVHGGAHLGQSTVIDPDVERSIGEAEELAPLHNRPGLAGIEACRRRLGTIPMVAVFDTTFHATLPEVAYRYALPLDLADRHGLRRFGFHGLSYASVIERYAALTARHLEDVNVVVLHLGGGCSAAAIRAGRSVDTSMGLTPLEGLVMTTRAGDLDPAIVRFLAERERTTPAEVERWLNERSGLLGLSASSADVRDLLGKAADDSRARLALDVFCYRAKKYVGAYLAVLGGADALLFTGGIGEHVAEVRAGIAAGFEWCGLILDDAANHAAVGIDARISAAGASTEAWVIRTDEESIIARETVAALSRRPPRLRERVGVRRG